MKRILCGLMTFILISGTAIAADYKIAVVDVDRIMRESGPSLRATKKLEKEFEGRRNDMQRMTAQGKALEALLDKNTLQEADRKTKERELVKLNQDFQRLQREFNEDRNTRMNEEIAAIQERARQAIKQIAESEKFDLVFQEGEILYRSSRIDITDKVIKLLGDK